MHLPISNCNLIFRWIVIKMRCINYFIKSSSMLIIVRLVFLNLTIYNNLQSSRRWMIKIILDIIRGVSWHLPKAADCEVVQMMLQWSCIINSCRPTTYSFESKCPSCFHSRPCWTGPRSCLGRRCPLPRPCRNHCTTRMIVLRSKLCEKRLKVSKLQSEFWNYRDRVEIGGTS